MTEIPLSRSHTRIPQNVTPEQKDAIAGDMEGQGPAAGWSMTKLLTVLLLMLSAGILCAFALAAIVTVRNSNQHSQIDNLQQQNNIQQAEIDNLRDRVLQLEQRRG